jgi:MoaA/NifB/PqqE/SkfB family radical SAM enzyme
LQFVRVTHPFHPLFGRQLRCVGKRYNRYGKRLLLQVDDATVWSVPPQWTDRWDPDPEVIMGGGRALVRAVDLMELASLVRRLSDKLSSRPSKNV